MLSRLATLLTLSVLMAACGGKDQSTASGTSPSTTLPATTTSPVANPDASTAGSSTAPAPGSTPLGFRVAFLGDQGNNANSRAVLRLVRDEGAQMLLVLGDFDYDDAPNAWDAMLTEGLGAGFPVFAVIGNHDDDRWTDYQRKLTARLAAIDGASCSGDYGVNAACSYKGLFFILSGAGTRGSGHAGFIRDALAKNNSIWQVCAWHKNQTALQLGDKDNEAGWDVYEECRKGGAIVGTGHEHSYERTKTLSSIQSQTVDPQWQDGKQLRVGGGSTFVFVSGLGGESIRNQDRCRPTAAPFGCKGEWATVYTSDQGAKYGALFIDFNVDGDPRKARGYFKNIAGEVVDTFTITATEDGS